jgi:hypothetical protein
VRFAELVIAHISCIFICCSIQIPLGVFTPCIFYPQNAPVKEQNVDKREVAVAFSFFCIFAA